MARNLSGNYSLPSPLNPVITKTTITTNWANTTLQDVENEITQSLDRNGKGDMLAPVRPPAGTAAAPAHTFSSDPDTGMYDAAANTLAFATGGTLRGQFTSVGLTIAGALAVGGQYQGSDGTAGAPGLSFQSDTDSGIYRAGANDVRIAAGGAAQLTITASGVTAAAWSAAQTFPADTTIGAPTPLVVGGTGVAFQNSWAAGSAGAARYWKDALGSVHIDRSVTLAAGTTNTVAFTLPSGLRPSARAWFAVMDDNGVITFVDIATSGTVNINQIGAGRTIFLDGIVFTTA